MMILLALALVLAVGTAASAKPALPDPGFTDLWVLKHDGTPPAELMIAQTLQGLSATDKTKRIWLRKDGGYEAILRDLIAQGVRIHEVSSAWTLLHEFRGFAKGMIVYKLNTESVNVADSLCGPLRCVAIDESILERAKSEGLRVVEDVRGMDDRTALDKYGKLFTHGVLISQSKGIATHLRDLPVALNAFAFGNDATPFLTEAVRKLGPEALVLGWGREREWVNRISSANATTVPADWSVNLSVMKNLPAGKLKRPEVKPIKTEDGVRYVAFVMSDGDNLQWFSGSFFSGSSFWASPLRGQFPMSWELSLTAAEFAPRLIGHAYATATPNDDFVTGAGAPGYTYPHMQTDRVALAKQASGFLRKADMSVVGVINENSGSLEETIPLLELPEVKGVLYKDFNPYHGRHGAYIWHKGKPCVSFKFDLRETQQNPDVIAGEIAKMPASPKTDEGSYALVTVLAWGYQKAGGPMEAVKRTIELLPKNTRVVTASQLIDLLTENFGEKHAND